MSGVDLGCRNLRWALALLDGLIASGLRHLVLSPGSRSTPVVLAAQRRPELILTPIVDERSAAFFALGLARASRQPVAVLATSGSAPAHWYPAVIEAAATGAVLVLLSADRPRRLRGWGANQTIDQTRLFGNFVREFHNPGIASDDPLALKAQYALGRRVGALIHAPNPGPVQINLPFDEPLLPTADCPTPPPLPEPRLPALAATTCALAHWPAGRGLIVCGPDAIASENAERLWIAAAHLKLPVLTDPLSGLRYGGIHPQRIVHYDSLLRAPQHAAALRPDWVLHCGRAAVSKTLTEWLAGIPTMLVASAGERADPNQDAMTVLHVEPTALLSALATQVNADSNWLAAWQAAEAQVSTDLDRYLASAPWCEGPMIRQLLAAIPAAEALFCSNSMPIRQLDTWAGERITPLAVFGNRGVSGIDGQLSTLAGLNQQRPTWGLLGDLSLFHDLSGLLLFQTIRRPVLVINNGGGRIFDYLPQCNQPDFERLWRTPIALDLAALSASFGIRHQRVTGAAELEPLLANPEPLLIEVCIDAEQSQAIHRAWWQHCALVASATTPAPVIEQYPIN